MYTSCDQVASRSPTCRKPARVSEHTQRTPGQSAIAAMAASAQGSSDFGLCFRSTAACWVRATRTQSRWKKLTVSILQPLRGGERKTMVLAIALPSTL